MKAPALSNLSRSPSPNLDEAAPPKKQRTSTGGQAETAAPERGQTVAKPAINIFATTNTSQPMAMNLSAVMPPAPAASSHYPAPAVFEYTPAKAQSRFEATLNARLESAADMLATQDKQAAGGVSETVRFEALSEDIRAITPAQRKALAQDIIQTGIALVPLSEASRTQMLEAALERPNGRDAVFNVVHSVKDTGAIEHLTSLANDIFLEVAEACGFAKSQLRPNSMYIKTWNTANAAYSLHQDKSFYRIIMGATVSEGEKGAPMEYLPRENMEHFDTLRLEPKDSFDAEKHLKKVPRNQLAIFTSQTPEGSEAPGLVHKSPDNSNGRTIALFRFEPVEKRPAN